tara:strand:+ start:97 stop:321 length:225 start_codon:yes stop_codon:yes gene_type:complete
MWKLTKKYFKDIWSLIWSKTEIDEKAIAAIEEIKRRYQLTSDEVADVIKTIKEVGNQVEDIGGALKGHKRKGRK